MKLSTLKLVYGNNSLFGLAIILVVLAILSTVSLPAYSTYTARSRINAALAPLVTYRLRMEQASQYNGNYGSSGCAVAAPMATPFFNFSCLLTRNGGGFTATATGRASMTGYSFSITEKDVRTTSEFPSKVPLPAACWLTRISDC